MFRFVAAARRRVTDRLLQALVVVVLTGGPCPATASDCIEYENHIRWTGGTWIPGRTSDRAAVSEGHAFVAAWSEGLQIVDVNDPASPRVVGSLDTPGSALSVAVTGNYAYVADNSDLLVVDISDAESPELVGALGSLFVSKVVISGTHAYVASNLGFTIVDISDPISPQVAGSINVGGNVVDVVLSGSYAYVAVAFDGLRVLDVGDPGQPVVVGSVSMPGNASAVAVSATHAFLAVGTQTPVQVVDIGNPNRPQLVGSIAGVGGVDVEVQGNYLYVAGFLAGLRVVDISDPTALAVVSGLNPTADEVGVVVVDDVAYVSSALGASASYLHLLNIISPMSPAILGQVSLPDWAGDIASYGDYVCVANGSAGLKVIDARDPSTLKIVGTADTPDAASAVAIQGTRAYVADGFTGGLQIVDLTVPGTPTLLGGVGTPGGAVDVAVSVSLAYVADYDSGLQIIDVGDPTAPELIGFVATPAPALCVAVSEGYAFVGDNIGLRVVDVHDPTDPRIVAHVDTPVPFNPGRSVVVVGDHVYVGGSETFVVVDITDPATPQVMATLPLPGAPVDIAILGSTAYVAGLDAGLLVIDIAEPGAPRMVGGVRTEAAAFDVALAGMRAFVAAGMAVEVLPVQCTELTPVTLSSFTASWNSGGVLLEWSTNSEADHLGFHVFRRTRSSGWTRMTTELLIGGPAYSILDRAAIRGVRNEYVVESIGRNGETERFGPVGLDVPTGAPRPFQAIPNPSSGPTAIHFTLPAMETITIRVFDPSGRLVRVVSRADYEAGSHAVNWDGRDDAGRPVPNGPYFVTLQSPAGERVVRVTVTR